MAVTAFDIDLGDTAELARRHFDTGEYASMDEMMQDAIRAPDRERAAFDEMLRQKVQEALDDPRPSIPIDEAFAELDRRIVARRKATPKRPTELHRFTERRCDRRLRSFIRTLSDFPLRGTPHHGRSPFRTITYQRRQIVT